MRREEEEKDRQGGLNALLGPSIILEVLDLMLDSPDELFNVREIARRTGRSPGAISRTIPLLLKRGLVKKYKVGKSMMVYGVNKENVVVNKLMELKEILERGNKRIEKSGSGAPI